MKFYNYIFNKKNFQLLGFLILLLSSTSGFSQPFSATNQVIVNQQNSSITNWGRGFDFTPTVDICVAELGKRPLAPATATFVIKIWETSSQTLIHEQTMGNTPAGVYTYEPVSTPVTLAAGTTYTIVMYGDDSGYYYGPSTEIHPLLIYEGPMRFCNSCYATKPFPNSALTNSHYGTIDFLFVPLAQGICPAPSPACTETTVSPPTLPVSIPDNTTGVSIVIPAGSIPAGETVSEVSLDLDVNHTWVGDLNATLTSPDGTVINLFNRPGVPSGTFGCAGNNLDVDFSDAATNTANDFENACGNAPAIAGEYQPIDPFSSFIGENASGNWILTVRDNAAGDTGNVTGVGLNICYGANTNTPLSISCPSDVTIECGEPTGPGGGFNLLITEADPNTPDFIEIQNFSSNTEDYSGWFVAISNSYSDINFANPIVWNLGVMTPNEIDYRSDNSSSPNYWGNNIFYNSLDPSWAILVDNNGNVADAVFWGWSAADIATFNSTINGVNLTIPTSVWSGDGIPGSCIGNDSRNRQGTTDNNDASDWFCSASTVGVANPGLNISGGSGGSGTGTGTATASGGCDPNPTVTFSDVFVPVSSSCTQAGVITRTWTATDACNNATSCVQIITINPPLAPIVTAPTFPTTLTCSEAAALVVPNATYTNGLMGTCEITGEITATINNTSGPCGGEIIITYDGQGECGTTLSAGPFTIMVEPAPIPVITPAPYYSPMSCSDALNFSIGDGTYTNGLTGSCENSGTIPAVFDNNFDACGGNITVYYYGTDNCGNQISLAPIIIEVQPAPLPSIVLPTLPTSISCGEAATYVPPTASYDNGSSGGCSLSGNASYSINYDYDACGGSIQVIYLGEDPCGRNLVKTSALITVDPAPAPTLTLPTYPTNLTCGEADALVGDFATYSNGQGDDCLVEGFLAPTIVKNVDACNGGNVVITYNGTDNCGNVISAPSIVIPVAPAPVPTVYLSNDPLSISCATATNFYPSPATFSNGENGLCENSGELQLTTMEHFWNSCDGGYILLQFSGEDNCGNALQTDLYPVAVSPDSWAPQGECVPVVEMMDDIKNIPTPDDLDAYKSMIASNYYESCGEVYVTVIGDTGIPECGLDGTFSRVYEVEITDGCGNVAGNCSIVFEGNCNPLYCTLTEEFYSTTEEEFGGYSSTEMINELINAGANPITVGSGDCGLTLDNADCIQAALAGEGQSTPLPNGYNFTCGNPINNNLVNQVITTTLNIRYNAQMNGGGLDFGNFQLDAACMYIPLSISNGLPANATVNDLLDLANAFIGCQCTGECGNFDASGVEADFTNILLGLNSRFNKCHIPGPCFLANETETTEPENAETLFPTIGATDADFGNEVNLLDVTIFPNPTINILNVEIKEVKGQAGTIDIFDGQGRKIATQSYTSLDQGIIQLDVKKFPQGMYLIAINVDGFEQVTKRFIINK